jgi:hypothetical protein
VNKKKLKVAANFRDKAKRNKICEKVKKKKKEFHGQALMLG